MPSSCRATTPASAEGAQDPSARMRIGGCERLTERRATGSPGPGSWTPKSLEVIGHSAADPGPEAGPVTRAPRTLVACPAPVICGQTRTALVTGR